MKLGPILLMNVLVATGAVFTYHMVAAPSPSTGGTYQADLDVGPVLTDDPEDDYTPEPALKGIGDEVYRKKVERLEKELASMKALLAKLQVKGGEGVAGGTDGGSMASLELPVVEEGMEEPEFSEDTLRAFRAIMEEVEQQRRQERLQDGLKRQLDRLGLELASEQEEAVIKTTLTYRQKVRDMWRSLPRGGDDEARETRREAMETVREEYSKTVYSLVPAADAEKIVNSMGRGMGFSSRFRGDRQGRRGR